MNNPTNCNRTGPVSGEVVWHRVDGQGEAMKPSPSPAAMTADQIMELGLHFARQENTDIQIMRTLYTEVERLRAASPGARALTEEEKAKLVPLARVADWGGLRDHNSDQLPVEVIVTYPQGKQSSFLKAANLRAFSDLFGRLTGEPSA